MIHLRHAVAAVLAAATLIATVLVAIVASGAIVANGTIAPGMAQAAPNPGVAGAPAWTSIFPPQIEGLRRCDEFDATIEVWNAADLAAFQLEIAFDDQLLAFQSGVVAPWLAARWQSYTTLPPVIAPGNVTFAAAADPDSPAATGSGEMAALRFRARAGGTSALDLHDVRLVDSAFNTTMVTSTDAVVVIQDEDGPGCVPTPTFTPTPPGPTATGTSSATPGATPTPPPVTPTPGAGTTSPTATDEAVPATATGTPATATATGTSPTPTAPPPTQPSPGSTPSEAPSSPTPATGQPPSPNPAGWRLFLPNLAAR